MNDITQPELLPDPNPEPTWEERKQAVWDHMLTLPKSYRGHGMTDRRVARLGLIIWYDQAFWADVIRRHNLTMMTIEELVTSDSATYRHCVGNFWGMLYETAIKEGLIRA